MDRRAFIGAIAAGAVVTTLRAYAQQGSLRRIGLLSPFAASDAARWHAAFREGLRELGWIEGKNIVIEYRYAKESADLPVLAAELVRLNVDIVVTSATGTLPMKDATQTIPIVMASSADPVLTGMVGKLSRPGSNVTGLSQISSELGGKRLQLLKEMVPNLSRVAVLWNPGGRGSTVNWQQLQSPARSLKLELLSLETRNANEFEQAFANAARAHVGALAIMPNPLFYGNLKRLADLALQSRLPAIFIVREFVDAGGLVAYGPDRADQFRRAASYVDKILKGAKPGDLPVEQPTKFELVINLKTAKALGLSIPQSLLLRADEVIQ